MNGDYRKQVEDYLNRNEVLKTPLRFGNYDGKLLRPVPKNPDSYSKWLNLAVRRTLELSKRNPSVNPLGLVETFAGKRRSVLDIWRHLIYFTPDVCIYDIMNTLFELKSENWITQSYCSYVKRRVFVKLPRPSFNFNISELSTTSDEFGLVFSNWSNI